MRRPDSPGLRPLARLEIDLARIELWNGDICDLEVDAIVNAANLSLWMSTGVGGEIKRAGGDEIEFAAVRQAPVAARRRDRDAGRRRSPAERRHPRRLARPRPPHQRRRASTAAVRSAMARARELRVREHRLPGARAPASAASRSTRPPGSPSQRCATSCRARPTIEHVIFALRGAAAYHAFEAALADASPRRRSGRDRRRSAGGRPRRELLLRAGPTSSATSSSRRSPARSSCAA